MALSDTEQFLEDLLLRFDPDLDLSQGSDARINLIEPILERVGPDPFDEDLPTFVRSRLQQVFGDRIAISELDALNDIVIEPMRVLMGPLVREVQLIKLRSSLRNSNALSDEEVDALLANFFASREVGSYAQGTVRAYFSSPVTASASVANIASTATGLRFFPTRPQRITAEEMLLNADGTQYYWDINYIAERRGDEYNVESGRIVSVENMPGAVRVTNQRRFRGGEPRESSVQFINRVDASISNRTLSTEPGIEHVVQNNTTGVTRMAAVGHGDPEMQRDIVTGGSLGSVLEPDSFGEQYGIGIAVDDGDGDNSTDTVEDSTGHFVSRVASAGQSTSGWFVSLNYVDPTTGLLVVRDVAIQEIVSDSQIRVDASLPLTSPETSIQWVLRRKELTLSHIPGGITLPEEDGSVTIEPDSVHIGGKTDLYVGGAADREEAQIQGLSDESPVAYGIDARTGSIAPDVVLLSDVPSNITLKAGHSLVLKEGVDAGSYQIRSVTQTGSGTEVRIGTDLTGTQVDLAWRVVDDIDVELTDPKDIRIEGEDAVAVASNNSISTTSSTNFLDAGVQQDDVLELFHDHIGGTYTVTSVSATSIDVDPAPTRTASGVRYRIYRRSDPVVTPVIRVRSLEILDGSNAPVGTTIPYRNPLLASSRSFQNEGRGIVFDAVARVGLVTEPLSGTLALGGTTLVLDFYDSNRVYDGVTTTVTHVFTQNLTASAAVTELRGNNALVGAGVRVSLIQYGSEEFIGFYCRDVVRVDSTGTANVVLGFSTDPDRPHSNVSVTALRTSLFDKRVRVGDAVEIADSVNTGSYRVIQEPSSAQDQVLLGTGPLGPAGTVALYRNAVLLPEVGSRVRIGRPSVGSLRVYYSEPTSISFFPESTRFSVAGQTELEYWPDPDLRRALLPAPPTTKLPGNGETAVGRTFTDNSTDFEAVGVRSGDLLEVLFRPITGTQSLSAPPATLGVGGTTLIVSLGGPFITISFPNDMNRDEVVQYINDELGSSIASLNGSNQLQLIANQQLSISDDSTVLLGSDELGLFGAPRSNTHPDAGTRIVSSVSENQLDTAQQTSAFSTATELTQYRVYRYMQRVSSTEMNENVDLTGLHYADVEALSLRPGNQYNIGSDRSLNVRGHQSDGYELSTDNPVLSYSRGEVLRATLSRSMLLVGSPDSPAEALQLSNQNVQVNYDRSQVVDNVQDIARSGLFRVLGEDVLVRHLLPHYVSLNWKYVGGPAEVEVARSIRDYLEALSPDDLLEVGDIISLISRSGASSVYSVDPSVASGRNAPVLVVVYHDVDRSVRGVVVRDFAGTESVRHFVADSIELSRTA